MKRKLAVLAMTAVLGLSAVACGSEPAKEEGNKTEETGKTEASDVANKDKPLVWFNRQPSNSSTGELDKNALNFNKDTYYVGFDANQGAELQGQMVKEYIEKNAETIDRNGDGVIGYVLAIGDIGHNDSIARTRGVRKALGTGVRGFSPNDIEILNNNLGKPYVIFKNSIEHFNNKYFVDIAISHCKEYATATAIIFKKSES